MNGLSDSLTIGLVLALVFGALFFYVYSRIGQVEKRVSLTENILLDLKMATENTLMTMSSMNEAHAQEDDHTHITVHPVSKPEPVSSDEVEQIPDDAYYNSVLQSATAGVALPTISESTDAMSESKLAIDDKGSRVDVNYESMTLKELKALAKQRGLNTVNATHKKDFIDILKRQGVAEPLAGSQGVASGGLEEGFPVEISSA